MRDIEYDPNHPAGALPYASGGIAGGDASGVRLFKDANELTPAQVAEMKSMQEAKIADLPPEMQAKIREMMDAAKAEEQPTDGDTGMPSPTVPDEKVRPIRGAKAGRSRKGRKLGVRVPDSKGVPASRQSARGSDDQTQLQEVGQAGHADPQRHVYIDIAYFKRPETPVDDMAREYNDACTLLTTIAKIIEERRAAGAAVKCDFCETKFQKNIPYAQADFQVQTPTGEMVWRRIVSCRNANCLAKYNNTISDIKNPAGASA